jgi:hypothetical protein
MPRGAHIGESAFKAMYSLHGLEVLEKVCRGSSKEHFGGNAIEDPRVDRVARRMECRTVSC